MAQPPAFCRWAGKCLQGIIMEKIPKPLQEIMLVTPLKYLYINADSMGNKHKIRDLRDPKDKFLDERRTQERWLIFEKNLLQAQEHAMLVHPPPCSSSGHTMISERLIGHHPLSRCCWLSLGCCPTPGSSLSPSPVEKMQRHPMWVLHLRGTFHRDLVHPLWVCVHGSVNGL